MMRRICRRTSMAWFRSLPEKTYRSWCNKFARPQDQVIMLRGGCPAASNQVPVRGAIGGGRLPASRTPFRSSRKEIRKRRAQSCASVRSLRVLRVRRRWHIVAGLDGGNVGGGELDGSGRGIPASTITMTLTASTAAVAAKIATKIAVMRKPSV